MPSEMKMEDELQKRNTDCVYFLASPLTCKKGMDCEYRHSEIARLNPRDCWYWLAGNCINPTCGFRHPPLDGHAAEAPSESAPVPYQSSVPVNKTNVPCYFYFNGFCNKGDRCSFLHGQDGSETAGKSSKTASAVTDALPSENKTSTGFQASTGNDAVSAPTETHLTTSEPASKPAMHIQVQPKDELLQSSPRSIPLRSASPEISMSEVEEAALVKSDSMIAVEGFMQTRSHLYTDRSSEEQVDDQIEREERWESSPGFDVLVDNGNTSENLCYEDGPEYLLSINKEHGELNSHFLGYDFEDPVEYEPIYPDAELLYEREIYDCLDDEQILRDVREPPSHARGRMLDSILSRKRKHLPMESAVNGRSGVDLRDHLSKRRVVDSRPMSRSSRKQESTRLIGRNHERPQRHGMGQRLRGRLASEVRKDCIKSHRDHGTLSNGTNQKDWLRHSQISRSRQHYNEKRQSHSSEVSRKSDSRERRSTQTSTFTGPKSLAEIKDAKKKKAERYGDYFKDMKHSSRTSSTDFQGPRPLPEILEEKKKLGNNVKDNNNTISC